MHEKDNYLKTAELSTEQNCNMIDGVPNNTPIPPTPFRCCLLTTLAATQSAIKAIYP